MLAGKGDLLPVSAFPVDGTWPTGTCKWEKRNIARRSRSGTRRSASSATSAPWSARTPPSGPRSTSRPRRRARHFQSNEYKAKDFGGLKLHHPGGARKTAPGATSASTSVRRRTGRTPGTRPSTWSRRSSTASRERENYSFFLDLPELDRSRLERVDVKGSQFLQPLFEYSGACAPAAARRPT